MLRNKKLSYSPNAMLLARHNQRGAALLISLVLLIALSLLGISAMQGTIMQERMSVNQRDVEIAFNNAESALRTGENWVEVPGNAVTALTTARLPNIRTWQPPRLDAGESWDDIAEVTGAVDHSFPIGHPYRAVQEPLYHVSWRGEYCKPGASLDEPCEDIYAVAAHGSGASQRGQAAVTILQSIYVLP
ncbi:PilX N-terminal domain-containing pilus assembly protein [Salinispirillum sp. LH 10-3-1]|uniref:PilX N-terminal domain-containing pilus assembly protein n=1 Tax=Salinispirillum sp. LH 10-3-1 TaxID=2952525 RepID=A0AB38YIG2_9GAMM